MLQSGATELIWHFAGYLHLMDELARARVHYEDMRTVLTALDYEPGSPEDPDQVKDLEELGSGRTNVHWPEFDQTAFYVPGEALRELSAGVGPAGMALTDVAGFRHTVPFESYRVITATLRDTSLTRQEGGDETNVDIDQYNLLNDNDRFGVRMNLSVKEVTGLDITNEINTMRSLAADTVPDGLFPAGGGNVPVVTANLAEILIARESSGEEPSSVEFGVYVDGVLQPQGTEVPAPQSGLIVSDSDERRDGAPPPVPAQPDGWMPGDPGLQAAELGSNAAYNAAVIVDADEACGTFVVLGDYYRTNVIAQTNVYSDSDHVQIGSSGTGSDAFVALGGNEATNIAEFASETLFDGAIDFRGFTGFHWNIDISYGDYYDVKSLYQENVLYSNDIIYQESTNAYYRVMADANGQSNISLVEDYGNDYDLIVVVGDYFSGNFIHQTNILLDNDWLVMTAAGGNGDQTVYAGQNLMTNQASVSSYGLEGFGSVSAGFDAFLRGLETTDSVAPEDWWSFSGSGSTEMNVLFVTGSYYDINFIRQLNLVADADAAMQVGGHGAGQFVSTGGNTATNFATIVDVGAYGDQYVGGDVYEDWTLVQTNVIAGEEDEVVYGDAAQLANEVVAFAYLTEDDEDLVDPGAMPLSMGGDELGHVMA